MADGASPQHSSSEEKETTPIKSRFWSLHFGPVKIPSSEWWSNGLKRKYVSFIPVTKLSVEVVAMTLNDGGYTFTVLGAPTIPQRWVTPLGVPYASYQHKKPPVTISFGVQCWVSHRIDQPTRLHYFSAGLFAMVYDFRRGVRVTYGTQVQRGRVSDV